MEYLSFACKWASAYGKPCDRLSQSTTGYCVWHLLTHRLEQLWNFRTAGFLGESWLQLFGGVALIFFLAEFFRSALEHTLLLYSSIYAEKALNYNPSYAFVFSGVSLILLGIITLTFRGLRVRPGLAFYVLTGALWVLAFYLLNLFGLVLPKEDVRVSWLAVTLYLILIPVIVIIIGLERRTGNISVISTLAGLVFIILAGLAELLIYSFNYLPWLPDDLALNVHQALRNIGLYAGIGYLAVAVDAGLAMFFTGNLVTSFPSSKSFYARPFSSRPGEGFMISLLRVELSTIGLVIVLYGQASILRHMLLVVFRGYPFDFLPWPFSMMVYMAFVIGIHYMISRRSRRADEIVTGA